MRTKGLWNMDQFGATAKEGKCYHLLGNRLHRLPGGDPSQGRWLVGQMLQCIRLLCGSSSGSGSGSGSGSCSRSLSGHITSSCSLPMLLPQNANLRYNHGGEERRWGLLALLPNGLWRKLS
jgi:hypothetical protein